MHIGHTVAIRSMERLLSAQSTFIPSGQDTTIRAAGLGTDSSQK